MRVRQSYFLSIGEYQLAFRQLANIVLTFANWRIHYGKTKIYWRISPRHSPIGEDTDARTNILFYIQLSRACALRYLRMHGIELEHNALYGNLY